MFVLDDASANMGSRTFAVVRVLAEALTTPRRSDPDPDDLLTDALSPWLQALAPHAARPLRWTRSIYTRNRVGRHRAASDVSALDKTGRCASTTYEDESAVESHSLRPASDIADLIRHTQRAGSGLVALLAPQNVAPDSLLDRLVSLRAAHGRRLRFQHCAEALTPLGAIVLSREWDDWSEASREIAISRTTALPPLPYHRPL